MSSSRLGRKSRFDQRASDDEDKDKERAPPGAKAPSRFAIKNQDDRFR